MKKLTSLTALSAALLIIGGGCSTAAPTPTAPAAQQQAAAPTLQVGTKVVANWKNNKRWYPGTISAMSGGTFDIAYDDGSKEQGLTADRVTFLPTGAAATVAVGDAVLAKWTDGNLYSATVTAVTGSQVSVKFYDGYTLTVPNTSVVRAPQAAAPAPTPAPAVAPTPAPTPAPAPAPKKDAAEPTAINPFPVGSKILAQWKGGQHWYKATVTVQDGPAYDVKYNDGDKESGLVIKNLAHYGAPVTNVKAGQAVIAKWTNGEYYNATVTAVSGNTISVKFYDGYTLDVSPTDLALAGK